MSKVESAISWMEKMARDDSHGYDQNYRWGEYGDYDCSAAVITAFEKAGIPVKSKYGATCTYDMYAAFIAAGFRDVTGIVNLRTGAGLVRGDVLLKEGHTAMYCGETNKTKYEVEAAINEFGGIAGGQPGDQTGYEFLIQPYRDIWSTVLRLEENYYTFKPIVCKKGDQNKHVFRVKCALKARGFYKAKLNYKYGPKAKKAMKTFQDVAGLRQTGNANDASNRTLFGLEIENGYYVVNECQKGDSGTSVLLLQEFLKALGYYDGKLDREFGPKVETALKAFKQKANKMGAGIGNSGIWDVRTIRYMIG